MRGERERDRGRERWLTVEGGLVFGESGYQRDSDRTITAVCQGDQLAVGGGG